jgi:hypothetical protein
MLAGRSDSTCRITGRSPAGEEKRLSQTFPNMPILPITAPTERHQGHTITVAEAICGQRMVSTPQSARLEGLTQKVGW